MNNCELMLFLNALSTAIAKGKTTEELIFLSLVCSQLSSNFGLLAVTPPGCSKKTTIEETVPSSDEAIVTSGS